jgi:hypothetical protein
MATMNFLTHLVLGALVGACALPVLAQTDTPVPARVGAAQSAAQTTTPPPRSALPTTPKSSAAQASTETPAVEVAGIRFDQSVRVGDADVKLNGVGIRYKAIFKVYAAALYLKDKAGTPEAVLAAPGAKRLHVVMLRDIDANELGKLFTEGMRKNATREEFGKSIPGTITLAGLFAAKKRLSAGDSFSIDYMPGTGTVTLVNGKPASEPITEPTFFTVLMKIWLGANPADWQLKDALLGQTKS